MQAQTVAERIIKARSALGWTQTQLGLAAGVAATQISRYESGRAIPRAPIVAKLAAAMNTSFDWLMKGQGTPDRDVPSAVGPGTTTMTFEVTEDTMSAIRRFAETEGLSIDMAVNVLIRAARNLVDKQLPDPDSAEQRSLFAQQVAQRVAAILHPTAESQTVATADTPAKRSQKTK